MADYYLGSCLVSMKELFAKIVDGFKPFTSFANSSILDVWQSPKWDKVLKNKSN